MDLTGFEIAEAAAAQSAELEAAATEPAADDFRPGGRDSTVAFSGAAVALGRFDTALAHSLVDNHKWDDLLSYFSDFMDLNDHPGLKFLILERQLLEHAQAKRGDAMELVLGQVLALCSHEEGSDFIPADLFERATKLSDRALEMMNTSGGVEEDDESSDLKTAICDYMRLYFPTTIRFGNKKRKGTLREFYHIYKDNTQARHYRCLVCQWIIPVSHDAVTIARKHMQHGGPLKHCSLLTMLKHRGRLTTNVVRRFKLSSLSDVIKEVSEEDCMSKSATSDFSSNKRMAEINTSHSESIYQVGKSVRKLPNNMKATVSSLLFQIMTYCAKLRGILGNDKTENGMEMNRICGNHISCAKKLYFMYYKSRTWKTPLDYEVFKEEVESMMNVNLKQLLPLLWCSSEGGAAREVLFQMDTILCNIREIQMCGDHGLDDLTQVAHDGLDEQINN